METAVEKMKIDKKRVTHYTLRYSYAAIRLQTVDAGEPVALYTVARELGHSGTAQIESTYGHVLARRVRLSEVRFESADVIDLASRRKAGCEPPSETGGPIVGPIERSDSCKSLQCARRDSNPQPPDP